MTLQMALTFAVSASIGLICLFYFIATLVSAAIDFFTPAADRTAAVPVPWSLFFTF